MSDPITMHWVLTHKSESQIRAEEESAGKLAATLSRPVRRLRFKVAKALRRP